MRIFIIARGYPTKQSPQWGCFERDQAEALAAAGHEVVMLSVDTRFRLMWRKIGLTEQYVNGVHSLNFYWRPSATYLGKYRRMWRERLQFLYVYRQAVRRFGTPDILYSHYLFRNVHAVWLGKQAGLPVVGIEHWSELNIRPLPGKVRELGHRTYPHLNTVLAVSESLRDSIIESFGPMPIQVVHNMAASDFRYVSPTPHPLTFVATGSLIRRKGFDLIPQAFAHVNHLPDNWQVIIVGSGEERPHLQQQIHRMGLDKHIQLIGQKSKAEIRALLQQSDAFLLPSRNENFSVAVLEALACGVPVISSICGGIRECIDDSNGLLFEVDDVKGLTQAIQTLVDHPDRFDHCTIAEDYERRFAPHVIADQLTRIFEETIRQYQAKV